MIDLATAEHHGVCPVCEGYGGGDVEDCACNYVCPRCWCPGCHDGESGPGHLDPDDREGSWEAYKHVQALAVPDGQLALDEGTAA